MIWKDIIFFSILILGFIVIILSIIFNNNLITRLMKPLLNRTIWRDDTKKVIEETVSASLSKALKDYNRYFEKD